MLDLNKIKLDLKKKMSEYRYRHSIRVAEEARNLASYYGYDEDKAYLAGLLHDIAKEFSACENKEWVEMYKLDEDLLEVRNIKICHAEIGALVVKELYGVDEDICQAIRYHTVGNIDMNMLDKIIFVADKIDVGKSYLGIDEERELAYKDIDKALLLCLINNKKKLESEGKKFNPQSEKLLNYLELKVK